MIFDPDDFNEMRDQLIIDRWKLNDDKLYEYAQMASNIRRAIKTKASIMYEIDSDEE